MQHHASVQLREWNRMAGEPSSHEEEQLNQRFTELVELHQLMLHRYVRFLVRDVVLADEIAQDTFVTAYGKVLSAFPEGDVGAWLRGIARNLVMRAKSRGKTRLLFFDEETLALAESYWAKSRMQSPLDSSSSERMDALRTCVESMKDEERTLLEMRFEERCSRQEIAGRLNLSIEGVKTRLRRIREKLLECTRRRLSGSRGKA